MIQISRETLREGCERAHDMFLLNFGHTLAVSDVILGQIYLVAIVSLLVGNLGRVEE